MFLTDVLMRAGQKVLKDVETLGKNTDGAAIALLSGDKERLEKLSDEFLENAAVGCAAIAMKKAGLGIISAAVDGGDMVEAVGDALGHVNPVVMSVVGVNAVMAGVCKLAADEKLRDDIGRGIDRLGTAVMRKIFN